LYFYTDYPQHILRCFPHSFRETGQTAALQTWREVLLNTTIDCSDYLNAFPLPQGKYEVNCGTTTVLWLPQCQGKKAGKAFLKMNLFT
jgi:hypothetical protein